MIVLLSWSIVLVCLCPDCDDHHRAAAAASALDARQKLVEMRCGVAVAWSAAERIEDRLQFARARDDDPPHRWLAGRTAA